MARDPYEYFRVEAREILEGLGRGALQLEKGPTPELTAGLLRLAHTLKGAARVVKQPAIAEHAHAIEEALGPLREPGGVLPPEIVDQVLKLCDAIAARVAAIDPPPASSLAPPASRPAPTPETPAPPAAVEELPRTMRTDVAEMDALLEGVSEASVQLRSLRKVAAMTARARRVADLLIEQIAPTRGFDPGRAAVAATATAGASPRALALAAELGPLCAGLDQTILSGIDQVERQLQQVRDAAERLRLLPARELFGALERTARDVARSLGKPVTFEATGGDVRIDAHVLTTMQGALVQMVRNAVAHGIEAESTRTGAGKPTAGHVSVGVIQRGNRVTFACRDDGGGIDLQAVRRVAHARGLVSPAPGGRDDGDGLDAEALVGLLMKGGLTTSGTVTELSGRGIGLDIVRETAARLGGDVKVNTRAGAGTTVALTVPVSVSSLDALLVQSGGVAAAIPLDAVRRTLRLDRAQVSRAPEGDSIVHDGKVIPLVPLALGAPARGAGAAAAARAAEAWTAVVVDGNDTLCAIGVDHLFGVANVVVRPLPALAIAEPWIAGAALDAEGTPQLVLDPAGLVAAALGARRTSDATAEAPAISVLIIDDSLTTRMLEQSILESAGYTVELATSAEEGLGKARARPYHLFLVDVEMPGMDGFTFVELTRADPVLRATPAILVTSRNAPEDRQRGLDVGARAYIVKSDFDQGQLLDTIRKLVGG